MTEDRRQQEIEWLKLVVSDLKRQLEASNSRIYFLEKLNREEQEKKAVEERQKLALF